MREKWEEQWHVELKVFNMSNVNEHLLEWIWKVWDPLFFERELASLVALQVLSSKEGEEGEEEEENFLTSFNKPRLEA